MTIALAAGVLLGARPVGGVVSTIVGLFVLYGCGFGMSAITTSWALGLVYRIKSVRAAPLFQVAIFTMFFLSTAQAPLDVMSPALRSVARWNPFTYVLAAARQLTVEQPELITTVVGLGVAGLAATGMAVFASRGLGRFVP